MFCEKKKNETKREREREREVFATCRTPCLAFILGALTCLGNEKAVGKRGDLHLKADFFTKPLPAKTFYYVRDKIMNVPRAQPAAADCASCGDTGLVKGEPCRACNPDSG